MSDWIYNKGPACPTPGDWVVQVCLRDGRILVGEAGRFPWVTFGNGDDIVAWRRAPDTPEERNAFLDSAPKTPPWVGEEQPARTRQEGGSHYKDMGVQPWDVVDTWPRDQRIGYYRGGALKYIMRMGSKDEQVTEIKKAAHYIEKLLEVLDGRG